MSATPRAMRVAPAWDDPDGVLRLVRSAGPYRPLARYAASEAERKATGSKGPGGFVPPWFRLDVATLGTPRIDGGAALLLHPAFVAAARAVFGEACTIDPVTVYVNVMGPARYPFTAHIDIPAFHGRNAQNTPAWLLHTMHRSGLFADERIELATAVSWFFDGPGGDFWYWPDGPESPPAVESPPFDNVAVLADNEVTFHGVGAVGLDDAPSPIDLTLDATAVYDSGRWVVRDQGAEVVAYDDTTIRITISWKAEVHADEAARDRAHAPDAALSIDAVAARLADACDLVPPADPLDDADWIGALATAYPQVAPAIPRAPR